jgi:hypothetical protein
LYGLLSRYAREQYDAGAGLPPDHSSRSRVVHSLLFIVLSCFIVAFFCTGVSTILPWAWIVAFFEWLARLFPQKHYSVSSLPPPEMVPGLDMERFKQDLESLSKNESRIDLSWLWTVLTIVVTIVVVTTIIIFLFKPLKSRYFWKRIRDIFNVKNLKEYFKRFLSYLHFSKTPKIEGLVLDPDNLQAVRDKLTTITSVKITRRKRVQLGRMVETYLRFVHWGETKKIRYFPDMTPQEYASCFTPLFPVFTEDITVLTELFEEALYGEDILPPTRVEEFSRAVQKVIHSY